MRDNLARGLLLISVTFHHGISSLSDKVEMRSVLLVDKERIVDQLAEMSRKLLREIGLKNSKVYAAKSGIDAIYQSRQFSIDLVLLDYKFASDDRPSMRQRDEPGSDQKRNSQGGISTIAFRKSKAKGCLFRPVEGELSVE